jgi:hypothetical protein
MTWSQIEPAQRVPVGVESAISHGLVPLFTYFFTLLPAFLKRLLIDLRLPKLT